ncbi:MAG: orotidine-5'-phosphate decarboxylase [Proteobacteria bacterium]|nr:orotidine-5'-phosphate decarboxylase [Pseudomonadota bacterium]
MTVHTNADAAAGARPATPVVARDAQGGPRIIVALDFPEGSEALALAAQLSPEYCALKIGKELFTAAGPALVSDLVARGYRVFLDLKYHDIPNTVAAACAAATRLGVWMLNVHAAGGAAMMQAAREAVDRTAHATERRVPLLIAVTVLTSLADADLAAIGLTGTTAEAALRLAQLAQRAGMDGVVCSAQEAGRLRTALGPAFKLVTPGIRPAGVGTHDHARPQTPEAAIAAGADYLVIGRAITGAEDPLAALAAINAAIA